MGKKQTINSQDVHRWVELLEQLRNKTTSKQDYDALSDIITKLNDGLSKTTPCIGKTQLAAQYKMSVKGFIKLLRQDEELYDYLILAGYDKNQRIFTPKQIEIIKKHFG